MTRVMAVGLDGFEMSIADRLMAQGRLPALSGLVQAGASVLLDHGEAKRTGLAWEHVASGLSPHDAGRWAAVDFDKTTYQATQSPSTQAPFARSLKRKMVVFDPPYFSISRADNVLGMVNWGAHDPGVDAAARPDGLLAEILSRFGAYPAKQHIYGFVWPSVERTRVMGEALVKALDVRAHIVEWLYAERLPDWDFGFTVVSEYHSVIEAMWHGVDPAHPLNGQPSAAAARDGVEQVYEAGDRLLGRLMARFPDAEFVIFNLHGMGANDADVASMALLPELMHRHAFGVRKLDPQSGPTTEAGVPLVAESDRWDDVIDRAMPRQMRRPSRLASRIARLKRALGPRREGDWISLDWMPASRYAPYWPDMDVFVLPAFYDGQLRVNLAGREARGQVPLEGYEAACARVEAFLGEVRDALTGEPVVERIERNPKNPMSRAPTEADLLVLWRGCPLGFDHPQTGRIGPLPYRRTGGHTGKSGFAYFGGPSFARVNLGVRDAFDVAPTLLDMLGETRPTGMTGESFLPLIRTGSVKAA